MKIENLFLILLCVLVVFLGVFGILNIVPPIGCLQEYHGYRTNYIKEVIPPFPQPSSGVVYTVQENPSEQELMIKELQDRLTQIENKQSPGRVCDSYGCYYVGMPWDYEPPYYSDRHFEDEEDNEYDLTVIVKDSSNGEYLEDAHVEIENGDYKSRLTDDDGEASFRNIEEDCYDVKVSKSGYYSEFEDVCVSRDRKLTVRLEES